MNALPFLRRRSPRLAWRALIAVMDERLQQITRFGHTPERDLAKYLDNPRHGERLARIAASYAKDAGDSMQFNGPVQRRVARMKAAKSAAAAAALIELIDRLEETDA